MPFSRLLLATLLFSSTAASASETRFEASHAMGKKDKLRLYDGIIQSDPHSTLANFGRAYRYEQAGNLEKAVAEYTNAIDADNNFAMAYVYRGALYSRMEYRQLAIDDFRSAIKEFSKRIDDDLRDGFSLQWRAYCLFELGKAGEAFKDAEMSIVVRPGHDPGYQAYLRLKKKAEKLEDAAVFMSELLQENAEKYERAQFHLKTVLQIYAKRIARQKRNATLYKQRGRMFLKLANDSAAMKDFKKCVSLSSKQHECHAHMGELFMQKEKYKKAKKSFSKAIKANPRVAAYYVHRGSLTMQKKECKKAMKDLDRAIKLGADPIPLYKNGLAYCYFQERKNKKAALAYARLRQAEPGVYNHYLFNCMALYNTNDLQGVADVAEAATQRFPKQETMFRYKAEAYLALRKCNKARKAVTANIGLAPKIGSHYLLRANINLCLKDYANVAADIEQAIALNKHQKMPATERKVFLCHSYAQVAEAHANLKNTDQAAVAVKQSLKYGPKQAVAHHAGCYANFLARGVTDTLKKDCQKALKLDDGNGNSWYAMGMYYLVFNMHTQACRAFRRAKRLGVTFPDVQDPATKIDLHCD